MTLLSSNSDRGSWIGLVLASRRLEKSIPNLFTVQLLDMARQDPIEIEQAMTTTTSHCLG